MSRPIITLTTDFGQSDSYVGTMKGVILGICPQATLVDISHEIRPQAVRQAAYVLHTAAPYFPLGTVHCVVVDPGVGSTRRPIAVQTQRATYVAPDNGVLTLVLEQDPARRIIHLTEGRYRLPQVSATFHGRDIFAPAAAHLAFGTEIHQMGTSLPLSELVSAPALPPKLLPDGSQRGEILHVDHFGNVITDLHVPGSPIEHLSSSPEFSVQIGEQEIHGLSRTFADVEAGELVAYVGSSGYVEIAVREGHAASRLRVDAGDPVQFRGPVPNGSRGR